MMSSLAHPEIVLITLWSNQWVSAEINLFGTKTDLTQKYLQRKIFWKDCEQTLRKNIFLWMMGLSIVLASVHIEENEKKYLFHLCMNALISASRLPSLHSRGFPCCGLRRALARGKQEITQISGEGRKLELVFLQRLFLFLHSQEDGISDISVFCLNLI